MALADERFLSWSNDGTLRLWDANGKPLAVFYGDAPYGEMSSGWLPTGAKNLSLVSPERRSLMLAYPVT